MPHISIIPGTKISLCKGQLAILLIKRQSDTMAKALPYRCPDLGEILLQKLIGG